LVVSHFRGGAVLAAPAHLRTAPPPSPAPLPVGSPADTQHEVDSRRDRFANRLHLLHYAERFEWSRAVPLAENGILIQPGAGDVLRYLQRNR